MTSLSSGETDPYRSSSQHTTRIGSVHLDLDRKLSETARLPKRSTIVEILSGEVTHSSVRKSNPSKNLPPEPTPADIPRLGEAENVVKRRGSLPPVPTLEGLTLTDTPQLVETAPTPLQNLAPYVAELTPLELAIVRHAAVVVLYRSSLRDEMDSDQVLKMFEVKRPRFWEKLFKAGNDRKKKGTFTRHFAFVGLMVLEGLFGVPLELLVERDGADSLHGASKATLRVPRFIDDVISAMRQMGAYVLRLATLVAHRY